MNILFINQPLNNRGDEAAHKAFLRSLCKEMPNVVIRVLFVDGDKDGINQFDVKLPQVEYINIRSSRFYKYERSYYIRNHHAKWPFYVFCTFKKIWSYYQWADHVVCAPGGICMGGFQNWLHLFYLMIAKAAKKPVAYYGRSIGPFPTKTKRNRKFKKISLEMMEYFSFFSLRDKKSIQIADNLGFDSISTVDTAFLDRPHVAIPTEISTTIGSFPYIIYVPNLLIWHYMYRQYSYKEVVRFFNMITDNISNHFPNHKIVMLPQTFGNNSKFCEMKFFIDIKDSCHNDKIVILSNHYSSDIQQSVISGADWVIGARYHSIVFALNTNKPCIALCYEHKMNGLLESMNLSDYECDITHALDNDNNMKDVLSKMDVIIDKVGTTNIKPNEIAYKSSKECFEKFCYFLQQPNI